MSLANLQLNFTPIATDLNRPVYITHAGSDDRLFVVEQTGQIQILQNGQKLAQPFLDISDRISSGGEQGLLSVAFSPNYDRNGEFYVNYTNKDGDTVVARYRRSQANPNLADRQEEQILTIDQPFPNHNGGQLAFGRDGFLYIGMGDGGGSGDPQNNAQNPNSLLGKLLRIDVNAPQGYRIPTSNPFVGSRDPQDQTRDEIWASGLRNPWRFSFDRQTGDLYIGDVGQSAIEEIDFQPANSRGGENYGWRLFEGTRPFDNPTNQTAGLTPPIVEYPHPEGESVTGGFVYRGASPTLQGVYLYGDFVTGIVFGLQRNGNATQNRLLADTPFNISTFGEDSAGNLYLADYSTGTLYAISAPEPPSTQQGTPAADRLVGTPQPDRLSGLAGDDVLIGLGSSDRLIGGSGNDQLFGNRGADVLQGDGGRDLLVGGGGSDRLTGGKGRDTFAFEQTSGRDRITDFQIGQDRIGLANGVRFQDLDIVQQQNGTLIRSGRFSLLLDRVNASAIDRQSFVNI